MKPCVVCGRLTHTLAEAGLGPDETGKMPCCMPCAETHEFYAIALKVIARKATQRTRIEDGICPNGCARLEYAQTSRDAVCPRCRFHLHEDAAIQLPWL